MDVQRDMESGIENKISETDRNVLPKKDEIDGRKTQKGSGIYAQYQWKD